MTISKREMRSRMVGAADEKFQPASSTLAERLGSLAAASSADSPPAAARWGRRILAVGASVGVAGWLTMGVASASAGVFLAATGNLPAPIQQVVADLVEVVGIDIVDPAEVELEELRQLDERLAEDESGESGDSDGSDDADGQGSTGSSEDEDAEDRPGNNAGGNPDNNAGGNGNGNPDNNAGGNPDNNAGGNGNSNAGGNGNSNAGGNANSNAGGNGNSNAGGNGNSRR